MKNILIAAGIVGAAAAGVILYMKNREKVNDKLSDLSDAAKDAAKDAYAKMNKHLHKTEKRTTADTATMA